MTATALDSAVVNKPVFLTKAHREELALKRRQDEIASQRRPIVQTARSNGPEIDYRDRNRDDPDRDRKRHRGLDGDRDRERKRERRNRDREREEEEMTKARVEREKEINAVKEQYLGSSKPKKRVMKPSEKRRFCFDWEKSEDTWSGQNPHEAQLLFGRGFLAGIDRREQKNLAAKHERERTHVNIPRREDTYQDLEMKVDKQWSEKKLEEMVERDWRIFKEDFNISYKGSKIPHPMRNWEESKLSYELLKAVKREKYKSPTAIQMATIPLGLEQRDVIGIAPTGSGKTVAFVLPMLEYIAKLPPMSEENQTEGPYALVLVPTRELAQQIELETVSYARYFGFNVISIVGGQSIQEQGLKLSQGCEIVIATPGRLLDCLERRYVVLNQCNYVVLDEADQMIDLGLEAQVAGALEEIPSSNLKPEKEDEELDEKKIYRTTYMFSATMPHGVEKLAKRYLRNPVVVTVGNPGQVTDLVSQQVIMVKESEKFSKLRKLIDELGDDKAAIVFVNTKRKVDYLVKNLEKVGNCRVTTMHGGKSQEQREISVQGFRSKRFNVMVATNVLARGFNELGLHVVNYDMPDDMATYTHRVGRTGRARETGVATTFLTLDDKDLFYGLKQMLVDCNSVVPPELARHEASKFKPGTVLSRFSDDGDSDTVFIDRFLF